MHSLVEKLNCFETITLFNAFNANEILFINNNSMNTETAMIGEVCEKTLINDGVLNLEIKDNPNKNISVRNSKISWFDYTEENMWLYRKLTHIILDVNKKYSFELTDLENLQYTTYSLNEFYQKHIDIMKTFLVGNITRKLSFSIQLTPPEEYDGGELCIYQGKDPLIAPKDLGSITFFPSFLLHEVRPVTRGKRISMVGWVSGPSFR